jgi:hypothetical protein
MSESTVEGAVAPQSKLEAICIVVYAKENARYAIREVFALVAMPLRLQRMQGVKWSDTTSQIWELFGRELKLL